MRWDSEMDMGDEPGGEILESYLTVLAFPCVVGRYPYGGLREVCFDGRRRGQAKGRGTPF